MTRRWDETCWGEHSGQVKWGQVAHVCLDEAVLTPNPGTLSVLIKLVRGLEIGSSVLVDNDLPSQTAPASKKFHGRTSSSRLMCVDWSLIILIMYKRIQIPRLRASPSPADRQSPIGRVSIRGQPRCSPKVASTTTQETAFRASFLHSCATRTSF